MGAKPHSPRRTGHYRRWAHLGFVFYGCVLALLGVTMMRQTDGLVPASLSSNLNELQPHVKLQGRVGERRHKRVTTRIEQNPTRPRLYRPANGLDESSSQTWPPRGTRGNLTNQPRTLPPTIASAGIPLQSKSQNAAADARVAPIVRTQPPVAEPIVSSLSAQGIAAQGLATSSGQRVLTRTGPGQRVITRTGEETGQIIHLPVRNPTRGSVAKRRRELAARLEAQQRNISNLRSSLEATAIPAAIVRPSAGNIPATTVKVIPVRPAPLTLAKREDYKASTALRPSADVMNRWAKTQNQETASLIRRGGATPIATGTKDTVLGIGRKSLNGGLDGGGADAQHNANPANTSPANARPQRSRLQSAQDSQATKATREKAYQTNRTIVRSPTSRPLISPPMIATRPRREANRLAASTKRSAEPQRRHRTVTSALEPQTQILIDAEQAALQSDNPLAANKSAPNKKTHVNGVDVILPQRKPASARSASAQPASALKPDQWSRSEIATALASCKKILSQINARAVAVAPMKRGPCGDPAPIRLSGIGANPVVKISPPAIVNCAYAARLHRWVQTKLQPTARKILGEPVTRISTLASYACRNRYGRAKGKISEHAKANALDIGSFKTADNKIISVLKSWGPPEAEIAQARYNAQQFARRRAAKAKGKGDAGGQIARKTLLAKASLRRAATPKNSGQKSGPVPKFKRGRLRPKDDTNAAPQSRFLHQVHAKACGIFGTVLGPEANKAHANHFHLDAIKRRNRAFCE